MDIKAFTMKLNDGCQEEYERRHNHIWPEINALLTSSGISDYHIFLDKKTNLLFAVQKCSGLSSQQLSDNPIVKKWWVYMADIMETNDDFSPISNELKLVFHLD